MIEFDEDVLDALINGKSHTFPEILEKATFTHNTLRLHLDKLVEQRLITREKVARGRQSYVYSVSLASQRAL